MKKIFLFVSLAILLCLISCSNTQTIVLTSQEDTLRNELQIKSGKTIWSNEIEPDRLSSTLNKNISTSSRDIITPQMISTIKELQPAVYPEIKGFASLDCSAMNKALLSTLNDFCEQLCKGTDNLAPFFLDQYFFNYVFFKNDIEPIVEQLKKDEILFERYIICKAFENADIIQVPLRFYNNKDYIDLSVYLTYHNGYKVTQIEVIRWGKTYGESDEEQSKQ